MIVQIKRGPGAPKYTNVENAHGNSSFITDGQLAFDNKNNDLYIGNVKAIDINNGAISEDNSNIVRIAGHTFFDTEFGISIRDRINEITDFHLNYIYPLDPLTNSPLGPGEYPAGRDPNWNYEETYKIWKKYIDVFNDKNREESLLSFSNWDSDKTPKNFAGFLASGALNNESYTYDIRYKQLTDPANPNSPIITELEATKINLNYNDISGLLDIKYLPRIDFTNLVNYVSGFEKDIYTEKTIFDKIHKHFAYKQWPVPGYEQETEGELDSNKSFIIQNDYGTKIYTTFTKDVVNANEQSVVLSDNDVVIKSYRSLIAGSPSIPSKFTSIEVNPEQILISSTSQEAVLKIAEDKNAWIESNETGYNNSLAVVVNSQLERLEKYIKGTKDANGSYDKEINSDESYADDEEYTVNKRLRKHDNKIDKLFSLAVQSTFTPIKASFYYDIPALWGSEYFNYNQYLNPENGSPPDFAYPDDPFSLPRKADNPNAQYSWEDFGSKHKITDGLDIGGDFWVSGIIKPSDMVSFYNNLPEFKELKKTDESLCKAIISFLEEQPEVIISKPMNGIQYMVESFEGLKIPKAPDIPGTNAPGIVPEGNKFRFWCLNYAKINKSYEGVLTVQDSRLSTTLDKFATRIHEIFKTIEPSSTLQVSDIELKIKGHIITWDSKTVYKSYQGKVWYNHSFARNEDTGRPMMFDWLWDFDQERIPDGKTTQYNSVGQLAIHDNFVLNEGTWG